MSFNIKLYNNTSAKNRIDKALTEIRSLDGELREECSIVDPKIRIRIEDVGDTLKHCNYMYIESFDRYYYITNIVSVRYNIVEISGHVDVLTTYKDSIKDNTAILARSSQVSTSGYGNTYLDDALLARYQDTYNVSYPWGYTFSHDNDSLILAVAGAQQTSTES